MSGHALFDAVLPILYAAQLHNISIENEDFLLALVDLDFREDVDSRLRIISPNRAPVYHREHLLGLLCPSGMWCRYDNVLAGMGGFGIEYFPTQSAERYILYQTFRKRAAYVFGYQHLNINRDFTDFEVDFEDFFYVKYVVIVQRYGSRAFSPQSLAYLLTFARQKFPKAVVEIKYFDSASVEEQALLMQNISLMIAVDGTAIDNALFMPPCSGIVVVGRDILNSEQYVLNDGFEMHTDHINLWKQWLSIELIESSPGSWSEDRGRGPLGTISWNRDVQVKLDNAIDRVVENRKACAESKGHVVQSMAPSVSSEIRSTGSIGESSHVPRTMFLCKTVFTPVDFPPSSNVVVKIELEGNSNWYQIEDFWTFSVVSSVPFISDLYKILFNHLPALVNDKNVFIINSGDCFLPLLSFFGRCQTLEVLEGSVPGNAVSLLSVLHVLFDQIKVFFQHILVAYVYDNPKSFMHRTDIDTLFVMTGILKGTLPCEDSSCSMASFITLLASKTKENLIVEFIPNNCFCRDENQILCEKFKRMEIAEFENALRTNFMSFQLGGYVRSTCSFIYIASGPIGNVERSIMIDSVQGIILVPENLSSFSISNEAVLTVSIAVTGPPDVLEKMKLMDRSAAAEQIERINLDNFLSPRLLVNRAGETFNNGCLSANNNTCFGVYTTDRIAGNVYYISYRVEIPSTGTYEITFQLLKNSKRVYKAHFTPEFISQHSITVVITE